MPDKKDIKRLDIKKPGFYDNYVEVLIDGMPVMMSANSAIWIKKKHESNEMEDLDHLIDGVSGLGPK